MPQVRRPQASWGQLKPADDAALERALQEWEKRSSQVDTLECTFTCWKYDIVVGKQSRDGSSLPTRVCKGIIRYAKPDKGQYRITEEAVNPTEENLEFKEKEDEYWVCDGNAVYEFNHEKKQLIERRLPNELKGKAISNSPLPFVFGTTAAKMRERYWMRLKTPAKLAGVETWLEIEPIYAEDRANYQTATVVLQDKTMLPKAVSLKLPNGNFTNYMFDPPAVNNPLKKLLGHFQVPRLPSGWKRLVEDAPPPATRPAPPGDVQTLRVQPGIKRK
ncbi:MAG TPA: TIGR03009 domain-containing protein [Pirellulales bacterium]|nr:TIGR03009 domain-containing protein [Pirellulales bacterium]